MLDPVTEEGDDHRSRNIGRSFLFRKKGGTSNFKSVTRDKVSLVSDVLKVLINMAIV
jgi:hypothetical protein